MSQNGIKRHKITSKVPEQGATKNQLIGKSKHRVGSEIATLTGLCSSSMVRSSPEDRRSQSFCQSTEQG